MDAEAEAARVERRLEQLGVLGTAEGEGVGATQLGNPGSAGGEGVGAMQLGNPIYGGRGQRQAFGRSRHCYVIKDGYPGPYRM